METQVTVYDPVYMGAQLKQLRKEHGYSQDKFAEKLNVTKDTIFNYEKGKTAIPHWCITQLCQEFNVSADYFFFGHDSPLKEDNDDENDLDAILIEQFSQCNRFQKQQMIDMMKILLRKCPAI